MDNEQNVPIDIHTNKLLEWLISRRHCKKDWQQSAFVIREKINNAIQDMPATEEITKLLLGSYINYFHCIQIIDLLKTTEANTKNIFGQYSSQRMKDWQEIVRLYEKDNVYLAEAAQMLIRNVNYEVPFMKRQILKCQQLQEVYMKKESDLMKNANEIKEQFQNTCKDIGIEGNDIRKELILLLDELPKVFSEIVKKCENLKPAMQFYVSFLEFTLKRDDIKKKYLTVLHHIIEKGNTTTYEWRTGDIPEIVEEPKIDIALPGDIHSDTDDQIDFGDTGSAIDFGDDSSSSPNGDYVHIEKIDFGEFEENSEIKWEMSDTSKSNIEIIQGECGKVARGDDALSLLDNPVTRNNFMNELMELEGFLKQRIVEMSTSEDVLLANQFHSAPSVVQLQTVADIQEMLSNVKNIISKMSTIKMQHLYMIKNSPKYVERLTETLKQKFALVNKIMESQANIIVKREEMLAEQKEFEPKLSLIITKTKELQKQIEGEISKRYKSRPVNIMGGVNVL